MFRSSKAFLKNTIYYFIPFILVSVIAVVFLNKTFLMLEEQNRSVMQIQMENILNELEDELAVSKQIAEEMCIDSTLSHKNMLEYGRLTVAGIKRLQTYNFRLNMNPNMFLSYTEQQIATAQGTYMSSVYLESALGLNEESQKLWYQMMQQTESFSSAVLEDKEGERYLFLLYYYPKSNYIEEKRIGFLFGEYEIVGSLQNAIQNLDGIAVLAWGSETFSNVNNLSEEMTEEEQATLLENALNGKADKEHTLLTCDAKYFDMKMHVILNNSVILGELIRVEIQMVVVGMTTFVLLSLFIWWYGKYRYRLLYEIKQLAASKHPELVTSDNKSDYEIIRKVLEKDFEKLKILEADIENFRKEARKQMSWLILSSAAPEDIDVLSLMKNYGLEDNGSYYCVLEFLVEDKKINQELLVKDIPEILLYCVTKTDKGYAFIIGISLLERDGDHKVRNSIAEMVQNRLMEAGYNCKSVACGLVYEQLEQIYSSQQEAFTALQMMTQEEAKNGKVLFFDEMAHMTRHIPNITTEILEQFKECLQKGKGGEATGLLNKLMAPPKSMAEDLLIYVRYKIIQILMDVMREKEVTLDYMDELMHLIDLESVEFEIRVNRMIKQLFTKIEKKSVDDLQIIRYIESNFDNSELSINSVAEYFQISERSVSRIIKKSINKTYKEYLNELRLNKVCELLLNTDMDIRLIVRKVGYYDVSSFNRLFKQTHGMTPMEFREKKYRL
ncbi:MAG: helix-turn-helix transcriptional regulator [Lachnospiraceae bacterium]|nr:helix-turn-helix transcriptional regulator [Lachnospiraceae bacterium]